MDHLGRKHGDPKTRVSKDAAPRELSDPRLRVNVRRGGAQAQVKQPAGRSAVLAEETVEAHRGHHLNRESKRKVGHAYVRGPSCSHVHERDLE